MGLGSRIEEIVQRAEHRMSHALLTIVGDIIEGILFVLFMLDDEHGDPILSLTDNQKEDAKNVTCAGLFTGDSGAVSRRSWLPQSLTEILQMG